MMTRLRWLAGWTLVPTLLLLQLFDLRKSLFGADDAWSAQLIGFTLILLVGVPLAWPQRRDITRLGWFGIGAFTALLGYALVSALVSGPSLVIGVTMPTVDPPSVHMSAPMLYRILPIVTAFVSMAAGLVSILVIPREQRLGRVWWAGILLLVTSLAVWPRTMAIRNSPRLATGLAGASVIHVVFLLCMAFFLGALVQGHRRIASVLAALVSLFCLLMTGSRAGLLILAAFSVLVIAWVGRRAQPRMVLASLATLAVAAVVVLMTPARRLLSFSDPWRVINMRTAVTHWSSDVQSVLLGVGSGRVWPWYTIESRYFWSPWGGRLNTPIGRLLPNPHSLPLSVLVELGLVGMAILLTLVGVLLWRLRLSWLARTTFDGVPDTLVLALVSTWVAFFFDYYLLKNFGISYWWWAMFALAFAAPRKEEVAADGL